MEAYRYLASVYDRCMYDVDYKEWYYYIKSILDSYQVSGTVLETACGTGNITQYLSRDYDVIALDLMPEMLDVARSKSTGAVFVCADMRSFVREKKCSAVICAMDGVNYLTEGTEKFFSSAYANLEAGGILTFDISSEYKLMQITADEILFDDSDDYTYLWTNEKSGSLVTMNIVMFIRSGEKYIRFDEQHVQRAFSVDEIKTSLSAAGFHNIKAYDFMTDSLPNEHSERIQFSALK